MYEDDGGDKWTELRAAEISRGILWFSQFSTGGTRTDPLNLKVEGDCGCKRQEAILWFALYQLPSSRHMGLVLPDSSRLTCAGFNYAVVAHRVDATLAVRGTEPAAPQQVSARVGWTRLKMKPSNCCR